MHTLAIYWQRRKLSTIIIAVPAGSEQITSCRFCFAGYGVSNCLIILEINTLILVFQPWQHRYNVLRKGAVVMMYESALIVRKDSVTTFWTVCLAVILAILLVKMNALAAADNSQNVVSFYPVAEQTSGAAAYISSSATLKLK